MSVQLSDVVDVLFAEFAKLDNKELSGEKLADQLERTKATISVSRMIVETAKLGLEAQKALPDMLHGAEIPPTLRLTK